MRTVMLVVLAAIPLLIGFGHLGDHGLNWQTQQVSTFAAHAPLRVLILAGMGLGVVGLAVLPSQLEARVPHSQLRGWLAACFPAAAGGLALVAIFKERVVGRAALSRNGVESYWQGYHDSGLMLFVLASLTGIFGMGLYKLARGPDRTTRLTGLLGLYAAMGAIGSVALLRLGIGPVGIVQRLLLLHVWLGCLSMVFGGSPATEADQMNRP